MSLSLPIVDNRINTILGTRNVVSNQYPAPTGTTSTSGVMMGLALYFTPKFTGRIRMYIFGLAANDTAGDGFTVHGQYGTGTAPANGAPLTGNLLGNIVQGTAINGGQYTPFAIGAIQTNLAVGTTYWFDLVVAAVTGGTASISFIIAIVEEF